MNPAGFSSNANAEAGPSSRPVAAGPGPSPPRSSTPAAVAANRAAGSIGPIRVMSKAFDPALQACQRCHKRKRKCDRVQPVCGSCVKHNAECVYDVKITDKTHPGYVPGLLAEVQALKDRVAWLEDLSKSIDPDSDVLANISSLPTGTKIPTHLISKPTARLNRRDESPENPTPSIGLHLFSADQIQIPAKGSATATATWSQIARQILRLNGQSFPRVESIEDASLLGGDRLPADGSDEEEAEGSDEALAEAQLPPYDQAFILTQAFFNNTGTSYPCLDRDTVMEELNIVYDDKLLEQMELTQSQRGIIFRVFLVFALGMIQLEKVGAPEWGSSRSFFHRAMQEMDAVLEKEDLRCVQSIVMLSAYMMFQRTGPSLWSLAGVASRLAIGLGLHRRVDVSRTRISEKDLEERRLTWWSVYSLDRLVSFCFGRPVAIQDEDIDVELPQVPEGNVNFGDGVPSIIFSHHIIRMRQIGALIQREVYRTPPKEMPLAEREEVLVRLRRQLDEWYEATPQGQTSGRGVFSRLSYFSLWHNIFISALYRPSPLLPKITRARLQVLRASSTRTIELFWELHGDKRLVSNHINLQHMFISCIGLLFCLCEYDGDEQNALSPTWRADAVERLQSCSNLLSSFSTGWPATKKFQKTFDSLAKLLIIKCHAAALSQVPPSSSTTASSMSANPDLPLQATLFNDQYAVTPQHSSLPTPASNTSPSDLNAFTPFGESPATSSDDAFSPHAMVRNLWVGTDAILGQYLDLSGVPIPDESNAAVPDLMVDHYEDYYGDGRAEYGAFN